MASKEYQNAAFDATKRGIIGLLVMLPDIPFVDEQAVARSTINSQQGTQQIWALVKGAIAAGEAADAKVAKATKK